MLFEEQVRNVMEAIADYLAAHPQAKDTRAGIRAWWLPREYRSVTDEVLDAALEQLAEARAVKFDSTRGTTFAHEHSDTLVSAGTSSVLDNTRRPRAGRRACLRKKK